ncbi:MAG: dihydrofolate reductase [Candidatus Nanopelagicus sp.]
MKAIIACDPLGGIGYQNKLPWDKIQGDLPKFKQLTMNQVVVMGRNTWDSLPKKPLTGRLNLVITTKEIYMPPGAIAIRNLDHFTIFHDAWVIGGASLINSCWHMLDEIHLTKTFTKYDCDTFIDLLYLSEHYDKASEETNQDHVYQIWKRK